MKGPMAMGEMMRAEGQGGAAAPVAAHRPPRPEIQIETLRDDRRLRVWRHRGQSNRLVVCFSGVGRDWRAPPRLELAKTACAAGRDHALYFADPARSWLNAPLLAEEIAGLIEAEVARTGATQVVALGHSLGGFSALVLSGFTRFDVVLALSPQMSIDPALVPDERRWSTLRARIPAFRIRAASDHMARATQHYVLFGTAAREAPQRRLLRPAPNVQCFDLPRVRHDSVVRIHQAGVLDEVVQLAFAGRTRRLRQLLRDRMKAVQAAPEPEGAEA